MPLIPANPSGKEVPGSVRFDQAADYTLGLAENETPVVKQLLPIHIPNSDKHEVLVQVRRSVLRECRDNIERLKSPSATVADLCLSLSMLFLGAFLSGLLVEQEIAGWQQSFFITISPTFGLALLVVNVMLRSRKNEDSKSIADRVLRDLPDPDDTSPLGDMK